MRQHVPVLRSVSPLLSLLLALALGGCGGDAPAPPAEQPAEAAVVPAVVGPALFDSIVWASEALALDRGATVYAYSCARCHGASGAGDGNYQLEGRLLRPPSFRAEDWRFARDLDALRAEIHTGNWSRGMPHWGERGLTPRDTDAVARYITWRLWARR